MLLYGPFTRVSASILDFAVLALCDLGRPDNAGLLLAHGLSPLPCGSAGASWRGVGVQDL